MDLIDENFIQLFNRIVIENKNTNFFDIISPKEVLVSEWLAFIFDPSRNGVGNKTIEKLLDSVCKEKNLDELEFIKTSTEVTTNKNQRMDILIKYNGLWIVIENKIESHENGNQTLEYYKYIESIKGDNEVIYIYLKPNYNSSIPKEKMFKVLTYNELIKRLKEISEFDYYDKEKYKYLKEFLISGDRFMKNDELDYNDAVTFYMNNKNKLDKIEEEYIKQNRILHIKIRYDLLNYLNELGLNYLTDDDKSVSPRTYIQYYKKNWENEKHNGVHFELMFHTDKILSNKVNCDIVLHLEGKIDQKIMDKFNKVGITKNRSLAFDNKKNLPISYHANLDFSTIQKYNESINILKKLLIKIINEYEKIIDTIL